MLHVCRGRLNDDEEGDYDEDHSGFMGPDSKKKSSKVKWSVDEVRPAFESGIV